MEDISVEISKPVFGSDEWIAKQIGYPNDWDTAAYPTLASALWELYSTEKYVERKERGD